MLFFHHKFEALLKQLVEGEFSVNADEVGVDLYVGLEDGVLGVVDVLFDVVVDILQVEYLLGTAFDAIKHGFKEILDFCDQSNTLLLAGRIEMMISLRR